MQCNLMTVRCTRKLQNKSTSSFCLVAISCMYHIIYPTAFIFVFMWLLDYKFFLFLITGGLSLALICGSIILQDTSGLSGPSRGYALC